MNEGIEHPEPLTPLNCDLRDFQYMPLDVLRLRDSGIAATATGEEFRCAVLLWCASWHQVPAASLPDCDIMLSLFAGFGRVIDEWQKVKDGALHGWIKCSDGRLYHPVVAEKANEAWVTKQKYKKKREADRVRLAEKREVEKQRLTEQKEVVAATYQNVAATKRSVATANCDNIEGFQNEAAEHPEKLLDSQKNGEESDCSCDMSECSCYKEKCSCDMSECSCDIGLIVKKSKVNIIKQKFNNSSRPAKRGSRLPTDWQPTDEMIEFCQKERPDLNPLQIAEQFRDYWVSRSGQGATKLDWFATWRNWIRNQRPTPQTRSPPQPNPCLIEKSLATAERAQSILFRD